MLDDLKYIHEKDAQDALGIAEKAAEQLNHEFIIDNIEQVKLPFKNIVFAGMGGSALGAEISRSWPGYKVPFEICKNYDIPSYVDTDTLFVASSYSGNTEETLTALQHAIEKSAKVVVIASGGKLAEIAQENGYPLALLPQASQPRFAAFYGFKALVTIMHALDMVQTQVQISEEFSAAAVFLKEEAKTWLPNIATANNYAKQIAQEIMGKSPVIYAGPRLAPAAYKWKISFNESSKNVAWWNQYPEFNHNEFMGWSSHPTQKPYTVIDLRSNFEHPQIQKRFEVSDRLLSGKRPHALVVEAKGDTLLKQ